MIYLRLETLSVTDVAIIVMVEMSRRVRWIDDDMIKARTC